MSQLTTTNELKPALPIGGKGVELESFEALWRFAKCIEASPFAPKGMEKAEAIVPAIQLGLELGLTPMAALQNVAVINGRPGIYGDAALALVRASGLMESYSQTLDGDGDNRRAVVTSKRRDCSALTSTFSVADAKRAGLWGKQGPWSQYPERMLLFRARGFNLRDNFGDVLKGLQTAEELGDIPHEKVAHAVPVIRVDEPAMRQEDGAVTWVDKTDSQTDIRKDKTGSSGPKQSRPHPARSAKRAASVAGTTEQEAAQPGQGAQDVAQAANSPSPREQLLIRAEESGFNAPQLMKALRAMHVADAKVVLLADVPDDAVAEALDGFEHVLTTLKTIFPE